MIAAELYCRLPKHWYADFSQCLHEWQTLLAGILAVLAGLGTIVLGRKTIKAMEAQRESQELIAQRHNHRRHQAYRAILPLLLGDITDHLVSLSDNIKRAEIYVAAGDFSVPLEVISRAEIDTEVVRNFLSTCCDENIVTVMSLCVNRAQLLQARMGLLRSHSEIQLTVGLNRDIESWYLLCAEAYAFAEALFNYSRFETSNGPTEIQWDRVESFLTRHRLNTATLSATIRSKAERSPFLWTAQ